MNGFSIMRVFTESYFRTDYNYIFLFNVALIVNFKCIHKERGLDVDFEQVSLKCWRSYIKS